jgi:hypothetical protein
MEERERERNTFGRKGGGSRNLPVLGIVRLLQRIAHAGVTGRKSPLPRTPHLRRIQLQVHQLVHVPQHQHVAVKLHDPVVADQAKRRELAPAVVEAWVVGVVFGQGREQVGDMLLGYSAGVEGGMAIGREGVGVEGYEGVGGARGDEGVV